MVNVLRLCPFNGEHCRLVSLVSVWGKNWTQMVENIETIELAEKIEIANIHAVFMQVAEKMVG